MRKTTENDLPKRITVDLPTLMKMLGVGKSSASQIAKAAGAELFIGRRHLYHVGKIEKYMDSLAE